MKKFFALVLAVAMVLSMSTAFATIGWAQGSTAGAAASKGVSISVKALEFSGTKQDYTWSGLNNAVVWKEITGRVVKDTLVKFPVKISVPSASAAGMKAFDYVNPSVTISLTNATLFDIVDEAGNSVLSSVVVSSNGHKAVNAGFTVPTSGANYAFTVLAIVDSTAEINCSVTFKMGQAVSDKNEAMYFGDYVMYWLAGDHFTVSNTKTGARIDFTLDATNKFTSSIDFYCDYLGSTVPVHYCLNGELAFNGCCACNQFQFNSQIMSQAWYEQVKAEFNAIMAAIGFNFSYGNFTTAYCTKAGIASLLKAVNTTGSVKVGACTELGVTATTPSVSIPQTGAVSVIGYALVALAGAALAISKKN